jgi:hypothetical protein
VRAHKLWPRSVFRPEQLAERRRERAAAVA